MTAKRRGVKITGELVPPGTLRTNEHNPFHGMSSEVRWQRIVETCVNIVANAIDREKRPGAMKAER